MQIYARDMVYRAILMLDIWYIELFILGHVPSS